MEVQLRQRTPVQTIDLKGLITHSTRMLMLGSCFADSIGSRLGKELFDVTVNPFGTLYNPASIGKAINTLLSDRLYSAEDLFFSDGLWHSNDHHSRFSSVSAENSLKRINVELEAGRDIARNADVCVITLGTSWIYTDAENGTVVSNCHKRPASDFRRMMMSPVHAATLLSAAMKRWLELRPDMIFILTVSPIRHLADGLHGNSVSKAALMLACEQIIENVGREHALYFPSYEIMIDDLRDYRWYASDMKHPSEEAVDYIYRVFSASFMDSLTASVAEMCRRLTQRAAHRTLTDDPKAAKQRADDLNRLANGIIKMDPTLSSRINHFLVNEL